MAPRCSVGVRLQGRQVLERLDAAGDREREGARERPTVRIDREQRGLGHELFEELADGHGLDHDVTVDGERRHEPRGRDVTVGLAALVAGEQVDRHVLVRDLFPREGYGGRGTTTSSRQ